MKLDFRIEPEITREYLLSKYSEETYMEYYLEIPVKKGLFKSPLRDDNTPTCSFYRNGRGTLIFKDFRGDFSGDFVNVVMFRNKCNYYKALKIIASDFGFIHLKNRPKTKKIITNNVPKFTDTGTANIQIEMKDFSKEELEWWNRYGITPSILKKYHVFSCKSVFLNSNYLAASSSNNPIYGYYGGKKENMELWRIYFPKRKSYRFLSNWSSKKIQGLKQLPKNGKLLVITKSLKDVMCLYSVGVPAIAPNSETLFIPDTILEDLKSRFEHIIVLYDNDLAGVSNMKKIRDKYNMKCVWIPRKLEAKDISDFHKKYGRNKTIKFIKESLLWLSRT